MIEGVLRLLSFDGWLMIDSHDATDALQEAWLLMMILR